MFFPRQQATACLLAGLMFVAPLWAVQLNAPSAMAASPAISLLAAPATATQPIAATVEPIELSYVPDTAVMALLVQPARVLSSPEFEAAPIEVLQAAVLKEIGIDPLDIAQALVVVDPPSRQSPDPMPGLVVRFSQDYSLDDMFMSARRDLEEQERDGRPMLVLDEFPNPCFYMPNDTTLIVATEDMLDRMLSQEAAPETRLVELLAAAGNEHDAVAIFDIEPVRPMLEDVIKGAPPLPRPLRRLLELPYLVDAVQAHVNLTGNRPSTLKLLATDEDSAEEAEEIINTALEFGRDFALAQMEEEIGDSEDPIEQAILSYGHRISEMILTSVRPEREDTSLSLSYEPDQNTQSTMVATMGIMVALLLPAINAARDAARRNGSLNRIRQLGLGLLNHEAATGRFPSAGGSEEDRPGLSWRVHILPYIEEQALYEQFNLDEPWDSEHNLPLVEQMPEALKSPTSTAPPGYTYYQLIVGEGTAFNGGRGPRFRDFQDGISMTALLLESDKPVIWTKPDDWEFDPEDTFHDLGHLYSGSKFLTCFADCHVMNISLNADPDNVNAIMTHQGGEQVDHDGLLTGE